MITPTKQLLLPGTTQNGRVVPLANIEGTSRHNFASSASFLSSTQTTPELLAAEISLAKAA